MNSQGHIDIGIDRRQESFAAALFSAYLSGDVKGIAEGYQKLPADETFRPLEVGSVV
jgi:hypothetical protein